VERVKNKGCGKKHWWTLLILLNHAWQLNNSMQQVLREKRRRLQQFKKFLAFYKARSFITHS